MRHLKRTIEQFFEKQTRTLYHHPRATLLVVAVITGALFLQLSHLTFDTSAEGLLHKNDPHRIRYDQFRQEFGQDRGIILGIQTEDIFNYDFLIRLKSLHQEIEEKVPYLTEVDSLVSARRITGKDNMLEVNELLETWPEAPIDMESLRQQVMANPYYINYLVSEDGKMAAVILKTEAVITEKTLSDADVLNGFSDAFDDASTGTPEDENDRNSHRISAEEIGEIVNTVKKIIPRYQAEDFDIGFTGAPVVTDLFNRAIAKDMARCSGLTVGAIALFMGLIFRRLSGVFIPIIVVIASVVSALGVMALAKVDIKVVTAILPVFILCVGVADAVHILTIFFREYQGGTSKEDAIARAMAHSGLAVLLTSLTTSAGLLSFSFAEIAAIGEMGIFSAVGVGMAFFYTTFLIPPLVAILPLKPGTQAGKRSAGTDRILLGFARISVTHPWKIVAGALIILTVLLIFCLPRLRYVEHTYNYFFDHMKVKQDMILIDDKLKGIITLEAIVDTEKENGIHDPDILERIDKVAHRIKTELKTRQTPEFDVHKISSINDIIKEINQALHNDDPSFYAIPRDNRLIAQELLLFENTGADHLMPVVDSAFSKTRVSIKVPWLDSLSQYRMSNEIQKLFDDEFAGLAKVTLTGMMLIGARTVPATLKSMYESYILAAFVISVLMVLLVGDVTIGLLIMFPNLLPILMVMGFMGIFNIYLDTTLLTIGSIAIGLVVDDTIHFVHNFRRYYDQTNDTREAIRQTFLGTGRALLFTSLILGGGFLTLLAASLPHLIRFGVLMALTIAFALLADFILAPALMVLVTRRREQKAAKPQIRISHEPA